jgi:hypothetical protein
MENNRFSANGCSNEEAEAPLEFYPVSLQDLLLRTHDQWTDFRHSQPAKLT